MSRLLLLLDTAATAAPCHTSPPLLLARAARRRPGLRVCSSRSVLLLLLRAAAAVLAAPFLLHARARMHACMREGAASGASALQLGWIWVYLTCWTTAPPLVYYLIS
jgi:hypothetical protein